MPTAKIRSLSKEKGFGFLELPTRGEDLFFHCSVVDAEFVALRVGQEVEYELDESAERPRASRVITGVGSRVPWSDTKPDFLFGFITKILRDKSAAMISTQAGAKFEFVPEAVSGETPFRRLSVGDYVRFIEHPSAGEGQRARALSVTHVERHMGTQEATPKRHPRARKKKPTWR